MSSGSPGVKYFLYIPVWATTQQPPGSSVSSQSTEASSSSASSESTEASSSETEGSSSGGGGSSSGGGGSSSGGGTGPGGTGPGGTGPGGTGPGGTGPGGTGPGGTGPGGTGPSGGSSNCLLYGTLTERNRGGCDRNTVATLMKRRHDLVKKARIGPADGIENSRQLCEWRTPTPHTLMPERAVDSTRNPETMTATERRAEIACILARGVVRGLRTARSGTSSAIDSASESSKTSDGGPDLPIDWPQPP